jgi:alpha-tubulin suppressor-like RCC1 family protein
VPTEIPLARFKGHPIVMLAAGHGHLVALSEDGLVYTCGLGRSGQLGHGNDQDQRLPRQVEAARFGGKKLVFVAAGEWHTLAVTARGKLYTWGKRRSRSARAWRLCPLARSRACGSGRDGHGREASLHSRLRR